MTRCNSYYFFYQNPPAATFSFSKHRPSGPMLSISRNVHLSARVSVRPCVHFWGTTSQSRMSNIFKDSESLGKSNGKKWSQIGTVLFGSGLKSRRKKSLFFGWFCLATHGRNHTSRWIRDLWSEGVSLLLAYLKMFLSFAFWVIFSVFQKNQVFGYSWSTWKPHLPMD